MSKLGLETETQAHRRQVGVGAAAGVVGRRVDVGPLRRVDGEAQGVVDLPFLHLVVAHEAGKHRQAGRVGRGPAVGTQGVGAQVEHGARAGRPALTAGVGVEELVEQEVVGVEDQHVAVAGRVGPALDGRVGRDGIGAGVALVGVVEGDGDLGLRGAHDDVGDAVRSAVPDGAEVGVQACPRRRCERCSRRSWDRPAGCRQVCSRRCRTGNREKGMGAPGPYEAALAAAGSASSAAAASAPPAASKVDSLRRPTPSIAEHQCRSVSRPLPIVARAGPPASPQRVAAASSPSATRGVGERERGTVRPAVASRACARSTAT